MLAFIVIAVSMALRDLLGTACTAAISRNRAGLATVLDVLCDMATYVSMGGAIVVTGVTLEGALALACGSIVGTYIGVKLESRFIPDEEQDTVGRFSDGGQPRHDEVPLAVASGRSVGR